jgi:hypothetical protein
MRNPDSNQEQRLAAVEAAHQTGQAHGGSVAPGPVDERLMLLRELAQMRRKGQLTNVEFERARANIIKQER